MKKIGLIGGFSWHSSLKYYEKINTEINKRLGGFYSADLIFHSLNFHETKTLQRNDQWDQMADLLIQTGRKIENAGAACLLLCANTMHKMADQVQEKIGIPLIHIAECVSQEILRNNIPKVSLLGTGETMKSDFYKKILRKNGIDVIVPNDIDYINERIFSEMVFGHFEENTQKAFLEIIDHQIGLGAQGIIYGCTEIPILMDGARVDVMTFDTLDIHAKAAVEFALDGH